MVIEDFFFVTVLFAYNTVADYVPPGPCNKEVFLYII